jgi:hypothetical protein
MAASTFVKLEVRESINIPKLTLLQSYVDIHTLNAARQIIDSLHQQMLNSAVKGPGRPRVDLIGYPSEVIQLIEHTLGKGTVSIAIDAPVTLNIDETSLKGIWRVKEFNSDGTTIAHNVVVAAATPYTVQQCAEMSASKVIQASVKTNTRLTALIARIQEKVFEYQAGQLASIIDFAAFSFSTDEVAMLKTILGKGAVVAEFYGQTRVYLSSTRISNVWWIHMPEHIAQHSLHIVDIPWMLQASAEDYRNSLMHLTKLLTTNS